VSTPSSWRRIEPGMHEQWHGMFGPDGPETPRPPLAEDEARFAGDPVALVVAESVTSPRMPVTSLSSTTRSYRRSVDYTTAESSSVLVHERHGSNLIGEMAVRRRRPSRRCRLAAHVVRDTIYQQAQAAVPMENRGIVVQHSQGEITSGRPHRRRTRYGRSAPACSGSRARVRVHHEGHRRWVRPEGHGAA